jgi:hypothetical protein
MANDYIKDYLNQGAAPSNEDVFVISSAIRRAFLHVPSVYDLSNIGIHLGHYDPANRQAVLDSHPPGEHPFRESVIGTFYGNGPDSFGPLERNGVHYTDEKPDNTGADYTESVNCVIMPEAFSNVTTAPASGFCQDGLFPNFLHVNFGLTYYFSGDDRLVYLPHSSLRNARGTLGEFVLEAGQTVRFSLLRQRSALRSYLNEDSMALYEAMQGVG